MPILTQHLLPLWLAHIAVGNRFLLGSSRKTCNVGGKTFSEGDRLKTADPCLECQCSGGRVDCRLRVCPKLPRPPPPHCFLLERPQSCCATMVCPTGNHHHNEQARSNIAPKFSDEHQEGCILNGTVYAEGSAMVTSSLCEYCYCIRGKQHCVRPKCLLTIPGCEPEYARHSCCPIKYICSEMVKNASIAQTSTTSAPFPLAGSCSVDGTSYPEGERLTKLEKPCEICYCVGGKPICNPVICDALPPPHCSPVFSPTHCCPLSYNCSNYDDQSTTIAPDLESKEIASADHTTTIDATVSTTVATSTTDGETTTQSEVAETTTKPTSGSEERFAGSGTDAVETTTTAAEESTTNIVQLEVSKATGKNKVTPEVIEALINRTLEKDADYEYDYNEPSLPPSLPNLKIIPFVAADAVLHENEEDPLYAESNLKTPMYSEALKTTEPIHDTPITSMFSPPVETEGGFVPKHPSADESFFLAEIKANHNIIPPATESSKIAAPEGEVPRITILPGNRESVTPTNLVPESLPSLPAITVADGVVTPNPFKDVIRTEQPPDLEHIMKDKPMHATTATPKVVTAVVNTTTTSTSAKPITTLATSGPPTAASTSATKLTASTTALPKPASNSSLDYDYGDSLSFSGMLDFLFSGGSAEKPTTAATAKTTTTTQAQDFEDSNFADNNAIIHKEAQDRSDVNVSDSASDLDDLNTVFTPEKDQLSNPSTHKAPPDSSITGLLKLAGCNIYGRIYRVGRIIEELSTPCLECLCTELGVQCRKLNC